MTAIKTRVVVVVVVVVAGVMMGLAIAFGFAQGGGPLLGGLTKLDDPAQCRTALAKTTSCRGEDRSFQECHYYFRADGVPLANVCRSFLEMADGQLPAGVGNLGCNELLPAEWKRVSCSEFMLSADYVCFSCSDRRAEATRDIVQAFTPACDRAIVLKGCNVELAKRLAD